MTKRTTRRVTGFLICIAATTATLSAGSSRVARGRVGEASTLERGNKGNGSPFVAVQPCTAGEEAKLRFVPGRNPFHGGGARGAYGDMFFASSGGSSVQQPSGISAAAETKMATIVSAPPPVVEVAAAPGRAVAAAAIAAAPGPATAAAVTAAAAAETPAAVAVEAPVAATAGASRPAVPAAAPAPLATLPSTPSAANPEPASFLLIGMGLSAIGLARRRLRRDKA